MIRWNAELSRRLACGDDEKRALGPLIRRFIELSRKARREGFASLEADEEPGIDDPLFKVGIKLVGEGISGDGLEEILTTYLLVSDEKGWPFLKSCVIVDGLVSLADGDEPALIVRKLVSYYGADRALNALQELEGSAP